MLALEVGSDGVGRIAWSEGLGGDEPPASAPKMVQLYASHLRRVLDGNGSYCRRAGAAMSCSSPEELRGRGALRAPARGVYCARDVLVLLAR